MAKSNDEKRRIVFMFGSFDEEMGKKTIEKLLELEYEDPTKDILMFISSSGGTLDCLLAVHDTIQALRCRVAVYAVGKAMSAAQMLMVSGEKGLRFITPNCRVLVHQVSSGTFGKVNEMDADIEECKRLQKLIEKLMTKYCKMTSREVHEMMQKETYLTAQQAAEYGMVDEVVESNADVYKKLKLK